MRVIPKQIQHKQRRRLQELTIQSHSLSDNNNQLHNKRERNENEGERYLEGFFQLWVFFYPLFLQLGIHYGTEYQHRGSPGSSFDMIINKSRQECHPNESQESSPLPWKVALD